MILSVQSSVDQVCRGVHGPGGQCFWVTLLRVYLFIFQVCALYLYNGSYQQVSSLTNGNN